MCHNVEIKKECRMALFAEEGNRKVMDRLRKIRGDGTENWFERINDETLNLFHVYCVDKLYG